MSIDGSLMAISINLRRSFLRSGVSFGQYFTYTMRLPLKI
jgi:hypothetical protein